MTKYIQEQDQEDIEAIDADIGDEDYGFIIGPDGELKHLFTPNDFELDPPPVVKKILKLLGIDDINSVGFDGDDTLH
jgi:hypothetical protein